MGSNVWRASAIHRSRDFFDWNPIEGYNNWKISKIVTISLQLNIKCAKAPHFWIKTPKVLIAEAIIPFNRIMKQINPDCPIMLLLSSQREFLFFFPLIFEKWLSSLRTNTIFFHWHKYRHVLTDINLIFHGWKIY